MPIDEDAHRVLLRYEDLFWHASCRACGWRTEVEVSRKQAGDAFRVFHGQPMRKGADKPR